MASEDRELQTEAELAAGESTVTPARYVIAAHQDGARTLEVVEGEFEQRYGVGNDYGRTLFIAVCRVHGVRPYRRPRLQRTTVCVRATLSKHDALWRQFLECSRQLGSRLAEVTDQFATEVERKGS
jgi:hypothetical protein